MMLNISVSEILIIFAFTCLFAYVTEKVIRRYVTNDNWFSKNKRTFKMFFLLFVMTVLVHIFVKYAELNSWFCKYECVNEVCNVICTFPTTGFPGVNITL